MQLFKKIGLKRILLLALFVGVFSLWWFSLPNTLFNEPLSCVVNDQEGNLLGARIADDDQWRFPSENEVPAKFEQAILHFEDEYFYSHTGFNPISMAKAFYSNFSTSSKRGGSTITQQVIRLSRKNKARSYTEKFIELVQATRLEWKLNKKEILQLYTAYAPFGGNVVGLESASWRYFGLASHQLTWGQIAALAVLPNAPSIIYPGKNEEVYRNKRDRLLLKLYQKEVIDKETYQLSLLEDLPGQPLPLPNEAFHLVHFTCHLNQNEITHSSIQLSLQQKLNAISTRHLESFQQNNIYNLAILVVENKSRKVLAYVGNTNDTKSPFRYVDMVQAKRSTGSTLKPFLYAAALDKNQLLPTRLVRDMPVSYGGYRPKNFSEQFLGLVPANEALSRSLNVPFVNILHDYGLPIFYKDLQKAGLHQIDKGENHYGLSLILGGAEVSLWELTQAYVNFKETYSTYLATSSQYASNEVQNLQLDAFSVKQKPNLNYQPLLWHASSVYFTLKAMTALTRPEEINLESMMGSDQQIAWKTGTSYGFKDAWSIGMNDDYTVGVWVGNADGEGRPNLTGIKAAAPVMFDVFKQLPKNKNWLIPPFDDVKEASICVFSGMLASKACVESKTQWIPANANPKENCSYHKTIYVDENKQFEVNNNCYPTSKIRQKSVVKLSPVEAYFTKSIQAEVIPPMHPNCKEGNNNQLMEFIFPRKGEHIILPKNFDETNEKVVLQLAHAKDTEIHWYVDNTYILTTSQFHETSLYLPPATYLISVVDREGNKLEQRVVVEAAQ